MTKKIIALVLAAAITTGIGGFGTYAYFTDNQYLSDNVNITMGIVDIEANWAGDGYSQWTPTNPATEAVAVEGEGLTFENVKPGDTFVRDVVVANVGTLKADMNIDFFPDDVVLDGLKVELVNVTSQTGKVQIVSGKNRYYENGVTPGGFIRATVQVTVPQNTGNGWMEKVINLTPYNFIKGNAHQTV